MNTTLFLCKVSNTCLTPVPCPLQSLTVHQPQQQKFAVPLQRSGRTTKHKFCHYYDGHCRYRLPTVAAPVSWRRTDRQHGAPAARRLRQPTVHAILGRVRRGPRILCGYPDGGVAETEDVVYNHYDEDLANLLGTCYHIGPYVGLPDGMQPLFPDVPLPPP